MPCVASASPTSSLQRADEWMIFLPICRARPADEADNFNPLASAAASMDTCTPYCPSPVACSAGVLAQEWPVYLPEEAALESARAAAPDAFAAPPTLLTHFSSPPAAAAARCCSSPAGISVLTSAAIDPAPAASPCKREAAVDPCAIAGEVRLYAAQAPRGLQLPLLEGGRKAKTRYG